MTNPTYVRDTANRTYFVKETGSADLVHVWDGLEVKKVSGGYQIKKNAKPVLVRKVGCVVVG